LYLRGNGLHRGLMGAAARWMLHRMRLWDARTASGIDDIVANSRYIAKRIWKVYRRRSTVIHPPVDIERFSLCERKEDYYMTASRLVPYKRVDLIVEAFGSLPDKRLVVIGDGPDYARIKAMAGRNVTLLGYQPDETLLEYMQEAKAFVSAAEGDFGSAPGAAQACGTPVIADGKGGVLETVRGLEREHPTGVFFGEQSVCALVRAVRDFEQQEHRISYRQCSTQAERYSEAAFRER